jgi:hypothetical protein
VEREADRQRCEEEWSEPQRRAREIRGPQAHERLGGVALASGQVPHGEHGEEQREREQEPAIEEELAPDELEAPHVRPEQRAPERPVRHPARLADQ